jgi:hypothetical protein
MIGRFDLKNDCDEYYNHCCRLWKLSVIKDEFDRNDRKNTYDLLVPSINMNRTDKSIEYFKKHQKFLPRYKPNEIKIMRKYIVYLCDKESK